MARSARIFQVFVASPSDVSSEREMLEGLVGELNRTWSKTLGLVFELIRWETHVRPALGTDPQDVVNSQIPGDFDVFIGILWGRFGTATPRALSGTMEEFRSALNRRTTTGSSPEIMIYFKDAPLTPSKLNPGQLKLVQDFKASLAAEGILYSEFLDDAGFQNSIRAHLSALAQNYAERKDEKGGNGTNVGDSINRSKPELDEDELGFLDYLETFNFRMEDMTSALNSITQATARIGESMQTRTSEMNSFASESDNILGAKKIIRRAAEDMTVFAETMRTQFPLLSSSRNEALRALTSALVVYEDLNHSGNEQLAFLESNLSDLRESAVFAREAMHGYRETTLVLPRLTSELNRAKRAVVRELDLLISELNTTETDVSNVLESIASIRRSN